MANGAGYVIKTFSKKGGQSAYKEQIFIKGCVNSGNGSNKICD